MAATADIGSPLARAQLNNLNQAIYLLTQLVAKLDQAEQAGRDVQALRSQQQDLLTQAMMLKQTYFPTAP